MTREQAINSVMTEADTCRELVTPKIVQAGGASSPFAIGEQRTFTNGRIFVAGGMVRRGKQLRADCILFYRRDFSLAVVEAKEASRPAETGVQQAREYAELVSLMAATGRLLHLHPVFDGSDDCGDRTIAFPTGQPHRRTAAASPAPAAEDLLARPVVMMGSPRACAARESAPSSHRSTLNGFRTKYGAKSLMDSAPWMLPDGAGRVIGGTGGN